MGSRFPHLQHSSSAVDLLNPSASSSSSNLRGGPDSIHSGASGLPLSVSEKFSLPASPATWGMPLHMSTPEDDDYLHNPDPRRDTIHDKGGTIITPRGLANLGCLFILGLGCLMLFAGYPIISHVRETRQSNQGGFNLGGINATGQIPDLPGNYWLIDKDTPKEAYTRNPYNPNENKKMILVFSDEFNQDGRTFYPGDDPFWEAVDLHYWGTNDLEWYDPSQATTANGSLQITIERIPDAKLNHDLNYKSAMLQTWNKFCFTGGILEARVRLPGSSSIAGLWPGVWAMGNLGRAGYGGSAEGLWPFTYDACDVGTLPNQTYPGTSRPEWALQGGDERNGGVLSYQLGQRLSACTCPGESHPGPVRADGTYVGRAAPEIDVIEATVEDGVGKVSQSAQWAPYNAEYKWDSSSENMIIHDPAHTVLNTYVGGVYQQTSSGVGITNQDCYELTGGCFSIYGFEYKPGFDDSYVTWVNDGRLAWTIYGAGFGPDPRSEISARPVPMEPMYIIANLGFSHNFAEINFDNLPFPATMSVDYIRVYQPEDAVNIGCNPDDFPTQVYIETYKEVYSNPNITTWEQYGEPWPKNKLNGGC